MTTNFKSYEMYILFSHLNDMIVLHYLIIGINYFIIKPRRSVSDAFLLGIVIYAVYETTSKALLKNWSYKIVFMDTLWGGILFTLTTFIMRKIYKL